MVRTVLLSSLLISLAAARRVKHQEEILINAADKEVPIPVVADSEASFSQTFQYSESLHEGMKVIAGVPVFNYHHVGDPERRSSFLQGVKNETNDDNEHWNVMLRDDIDDDRLDVICKNHKCAWHGSKEGIPFIEIRGTEKDLEDTLNDLEGEVEFVEPDSGVSASSAAASESSADRPWGLDRVGSTHSGGEGVHVYVLDTGVRTSHVEFGDRAFNTLESLSSGVMECHGSRYCAVDNQGHGTHCAGTVGGANKGVAPDAFLHGVKVLGDDGRGSNSYIIAAMDWIIARGKRPAVLSMSLGGPGRSMAMVRAVDRAVAAGIPVIVAAGNDNKNADDYSPASVPSAFTVGSVAQSRWSGGDEKSSFSNWGQSLDIFAPGSDVESASHTSDRGYTTMSGTSMATPHVAGAAALILSKEPNLRPQQVYERLLDTADSNKIPNTYGSVNKVLNVRKLVGGGSSSPSPAPAPAPAPASPTSCPSAFSKYTTPSSNGYCFCRDGTSCFDGSIGGCFLRQANVHASNAFEVSCKTCKCLSSEPAPAPSTGFCPRGTQLATSIGKCGCSSFTRCYQDSSARVSGCPWSVGKTHTSNYYFDPACTTCHCK